MQLFNGEDIIRNYTPFQKNTCFWNSQIAYKKFMKNTSELKIYLMKQGISWLLNERKETESYWNQNVYILIETLIDLLLCSTISKKKGTERENRNHFYNLDTWGHN